MSKKKLQPNQEPRVMDAILREHAEKCQKLGNLQYQTILLKKEIDTITERMGELDREYQLRQKLNASKPAEVQLPPTAATEVANANA